MARASSSISGAVSVEDNGLPGNKTNMQKKGDYGVRVARWGYDAGSCDDGDLLFNSSWPIVQVVKYIKPDVPWEEVELTELPEDEPYEFTQSESYSDFCYGVDRKYVYKITGWSLYQYREVVGTTEWGEEIYDFHFFYKPTAYRYRHNLGYKPMFLNSELLSGDEVTGGLLLTNINLEDDVDYPYLSKPKIASTKVADYGIESKAYYSSKLNTHNMRYVGLSSNIQSMMVQAIKTSKTSSKSGWGRGFEDFASGGVVYYPPTTGKGRPIFSSEQLTYLGFLGQVGGAISVQGGGFGNDGSLRNIYSNISDNINMGFSSLLFNTRVGMGYGSANIVVPKASTYSGEGPEPTENPRTAVIVCLRCPMVSPELIQVEV